MLTNQVSYVIGLILSLFSLLSFIEHDDTAAKFDFFHRNDEIKLHIEIAKHDLEFALGTISKKKLNKYLKKKTKWVVNGELVQFRVEEVNLSEANYKLICFTDYKVNEISSIEVRNSCMSAHNHHHSNIMSFYVNGKHRAFRMNEKRKKIELSY